MEEQTVQLEALRFYGQEGPIAIIHYQDTRKAYTMSGIDALIETSEGSRFQDQFKLIKKDMLKACQSNHEQLPDVDADDVSGQETLF